MSNNMQWNRTWLKDIIDNNNSPLKILSIQIANIFRIENNDAIYIFDEVGTGKTIESGLMAKHYIYNFYKNGREKELKDRSKYLDACVITINQNISSFKDKWVKFIGLDNGGKFDGNEINIEFINNRNSNIKQIAERYDEIGVLVVDEAHYFVTDDENERTKELKKLNANKIIYLTATPIKYSSLKFNEEDKKVMVFEYNKYNALTLNIKKNVHIDFGNGKIFNLDSEREVLKPLYNPLTHSDEDSVLNKLKSITWANNKENVSIDEAKTIMKEIGYVDFSKYLSVEQDGKTIVNRFDLRAPVTRYFKTTVMALKDYSCKNAEIKRNLADIIETNTCNVIDKSEHVAKYIEERMNEINSDSSILDNKYPRFVVFTRQKWEQEKLVEALQKYGYCMFNYSDVNNNAFKTFQIVNGDTKSDILKYCESENISSDSCILPRVLIITYQLAEAGIDLPCFSHIINFYISAFPSSLEQRFGRIDRLNKDNMSVYNNITMVYVLGDSDDVNTRNFNMAINTYLGNLNLVNFPVKNVLFDKEGKVFEKWNYNPNYLIEYYDSILKKIDNNNDSEKEIIFDWYKYWKDDNMDFFTKNDKMNKIIEMITPEANEVIEFIKDRHYDVLNNDKDIYIEASERSDIEGMKEAFLNFWIHLSKKVEVLKKNQLEKRIDSSVKTILLNNADKIFYYDTNTCEFATLDANDCAKQIYSSQNYQDFISELKKII